MKTLSRLQFYLILLFGDVFCYFVLFFVLRFSVSNSSGGGNMLAGLTEGVIFFASIILIIIISLILIRVYEINMTPERGKHKFIIYIYFFVIFIAYSFPFVGIPMLDKFGEKKLKKQEARDEQVMGVFAQQDNYQACLEYYKNKYRGGHTPTGLCDTYFSYYNAKIASLKRDISFCHDDLCYLEYSKASLDINACFKIEKNSDKIKCIINIAQKTSNTSVCEYIGKPKPYEYDNMKDCIINIINNENIKKYNSIFDTSMCLNINDIDIKKECFLVFTKKIR